MRGHIRKRKNSYAIVIDVGRDPATGKRKQQWVSVKGTKKDAEKKLSELLNQLDNGTYIKPSKSTFSDFLEVWLRDYVWQLAPRTAEGYEHILRCHVIPSLGNINLVQLKPEHLQRYCSSKIENGRVDGKGGLSSRTVRHHYMAIHKALSCAVKWGMLARNVADAITPPREQYIEMKIMNEREINLFLEAARSTQYYPLFYVALFTGMRRSEELALRWSDVDLILCQISVNKAMHHLKDGRIVFRQPKTDKGRRLIDLSPSTVQVLREHRQNQEDIRIRTGNLLSDNDLVFCNAEGKPLLPHTVSHAWSKIANKVGLKGITLHSARHTHASLMLKQGTHPKIVQERLGHSSIQMTLDLYSHVAPGLQAAAAERFDEWFKSFASVKVPDYQVQEY